MILLGAGAVPRGGARAKKALGRALRRPVWAGMPAPVERLLQATPSTWVVTAFSMPQAIGF